MFDSTTEAQEVAAAFPSEISGKTFAITGVGFGGLGTALLAGKLSSSEASPVQRRVINVSSSAHTISRFRSSDPHFIGSSDLLPDEEPSREARKACDIPWGTGCSLLMAYAQSKTSLILHAKAISSGVLEEGSQRSPSIRV
ncbi:short-chain dehydrogenase tic chloroplastic, partial [Fusarium sporotrichioides]